MSFNPTTTAQGADGYLAFFTGKSALAGDNDLFWDRVNNTLSVGSSQTDGASKLHITTNELTTQNGLKIDHGTTNLIVRPTTNGFTSTVIENTGTGSLLLNPSGSPVGIGTTLSNAGIILDVNVNTASTGVAIVQAKNAGSGDSFIRVVRASAASYAIGVNSAGQFRIGYDGGVSADLVTAGWFTYSPTGSDVGLFIGTHVRTSGSLTVQGVIKNAHLSETLETIVIALDGYSTVNDTASTGDGYIAFFTSTGKNIAGDNDLYYNRTSGVLTVNGGITSPGIGTNSEQFGNFASASGNTSVALGYSATASGVNSIAIGASSNVSAAATNSIVVGYNVSNTVSANSVIVGNSASVSGSTSVVVGTGATASGADVAIGNSSVATDFSVAVGAGADTIVGGVAIGYNSSISGRDSVAIGYSASSTGIESIAIGKSATIPVGYQNSLAIGSGATVTGNNSGEIGTAAVPISLKLYGNFIAVKDINVGGNIVNKDLSETFMIIRQSLDGYVQNTTVTEHYNQFTQIIQDIRSASDGYAQNQTVTEHYNQFNQAIQDITSTIDGYATDNDVFSLTSTVTQNFNAQQQINQSIIQAIDGYAQNTTVTENKNAQQQINQSILQALDGYVVIGSGISELTFNENKNAQQQINQSILQALDGYAQNQTVTEHYNQFNQAIQDITSTIDGYATDADVSTLTSTVSGLNSTVTEHYNQFNQAIQDITSIIDGYATDADVSTLTSTVTGLNTTVTEHYNQFNQAIQDITSTIDGYAQNQTVTEHYNQFNQAIQDITSTIDGYATDADVSTLTSTVSGLNSTVTEHYNQFNQAIQDITSIIDGYATDADVSTLTSTVTGLNLTVTEHYNQFNQAIQDIISATDSYGLGATVLDTAATGDGYIAFFTSTGKNIAGDGDLYYNRETGRLGLNKSVPEYTLDVDGQIKGSSETYPAVIAERSDTNTDGANAALSCTHTSSGDMIDGFGAGLGFEIKDNAGVRNTIGAIYGVRSGADNSGYMMFRTYSAGVGTEQLRIASNGDVSIGGIAPTEKLHVYETVNGGSGIFVQNPNVGASASAYVQVTSDSADLVMQTVSAANTTTLAGGAVADRGVIYTSSAASNGLYIGTHAAAQLVLSTNNTERVRILSGGNVGIGTATPGQKLTVAGDIGVAGNIVNTHLSETFQVIRQALDGYAQVTNTAATGDGYIAFFTSTGTSLAGDNDLYFDRANSQLKINTTYAAATAALFVGGTIASLYEEETKAAGFQIQSPSGSARYGLKFGSAGQVHDTTVLMLTNRDPLGALAFATDNGLSGAGGETERMRILGGTEVRVGIGTRFPIEALTVNGTIALQELEITEAPTTQDGYGKIYVASDNTLHYKNGIGVDQIVMSSTLPFNSAGADGYLAFYTDTATLAGDNDLFWDRANNRLGIGTITPTHSLTVDGYITPTIDNVYCLGTPSQRWESIYVGPNSLHLVSSSAETGTAYDWRLGIDQTTGNNGNLIFTQGQNTHMMIDSESGYIGIGTNTPSTALHVNGTITTGQEASSVGVATLYPWVLNLGQGRTGDGVAHLDLIGYSGESDYNLRLIHWGGLNGTSQLIHKGTGTLTVTAESTGSVALQTQGLSRLLVDSSGYVGINTATTSAAQVYIYRNQASTATSIQRLTSDITASSSPGTYYFGQEMFQAIGHSGTVANLIGHYLDANSSLTNTVTSLYGYWARQRSAANAPTFSNVYSFYSEGPNMSAGGSVGVYSAFFAGPGAGTITNKFALYSPYDGMHVDVGGDIKVGSNSNGAMLELRRNNVNYINCSVAGGSLALCVNGDGTSIGASSLYITSGGVITTGGGSGGTASTGGIEINTAQSAVALLHRGTSLAHGMTSIVPTDVGWYFTSTTGGGGSFVGLSTGSVAHAAAAYTTTADTSNTTSSRGAYEILAALKSGTTVTTHGTTTNIVAMRNLSTAVFLLKGNGNLNLGGTVSTISDRRAKENIIPHEDALSKILQLNPVRFNMKEPLSDGILRRGFIAQEVKEVFPDLVRGTEAENDSLVLDYTSLIPVLVKTIQEQQEQIKDLQNRIEQLENA